MVVRVVTRTDSLMAQAKELIAKHVPEYTFEWDRGLRRFGACKYGPKVISVSLPLTEKNSDEEFFKVVMHEIAHAMVGPFELGWDGKPIVVRNRGRVTYKSTGHGTKWKLQMIALGQSPDRCHNAEIAEEQYKYIGRCPNGHTQKRFRLTDKAKRISCGKCSRTYNPAFKFRWAEIR